MTRIMISSMVIKYYVCISLYVYIYIYTHTHTYTKYIYTYTYIYTYICIKVPPERGRAGLLTSPPEMVCPMSFGALALENIDWGMMTN